MSTTLTDVPSTAPQSQSSAARNASSSTLNLARIRASLPGMFKKLDPLTLLRNPVILMVWIGAVFTTALAIVEPFLGASASQGADAVPPGFTWLISIFLWLTLLFANLAESVAEGRGKAQADSLRATRSSTTASRVKSYQETNDPQAQRSSTEEVPSPDLRVGDVVVVVAGELIPGDGDIISGIATVDESAITGESAPVIRESGGDRSAVTGGTRVLSDRIVVKITAATGESFVDRMIALVEGSNRQRTPNEIALNILLASLSFVFVVVALTLNPIASYPADPVSLAVLVALLVCLIPTTISALLSAIGIAGMDRLVQHNVLAKSGRAVEAAGDVSTLLLDKTGTITEGNRQATDVAPMPGVTKDEVLRAAAWASVADVTPEGASIVTLARRRELDVPAELGESVPFTAQTRMSGVDLSDGTRIRKGAGTAILGWIEREDSALATLQRQQLQERTQEISRAGGTPLVVAVSRPAQGTRRASTRVLGVVYLKDIIKPGLSERFEQLREMGIRTVMITGDNPLTAAAIAREAGVDGYLAEATPEDKLALIREEQSKGQMVAMTGDGTNDAPALAQADVGVAMNTGTSAAKDAGNMVDLDSDPTKLIDIVRIGKQLLITRGALTTFSIANDIAKYFAIIPAMFMTAFPNLGALNVMGLHSPSSAVLSAVIFNALVILVLVPLALRGVAYRPASASVVLRRNLLVYGLGGVITPFLGIWVIDLLVRLLPGF